MQRGSIRRPDPLTVVLDKVVDAETLGVAVAALATRVGLVSVREIAAQTGTPKTTVHRWHRGANPEC